MPRSAVRARQRLAAKRASLLMSANPWLAAAECALLQPDADAEPVALRLVQRLIELALFKQSSAELGPAMLEEIGAVLRADMAHVYEGPPPWKAVWAFTRRGLGKPNLTLPATTMGE